MITQLSGQQWIIQDALGQEHCLLIDGKMLLVDGVPSSVTVEEKQIIFMRPQEAPVSCATGAFWCAFAGKESLPTPEDAGVQLAQSLAGWLLYQRLTARLRALLDEFQGALEAYEQEARALLLPEPCLDLFTLRVLGRIDGSPESEQAVAHVLGVPNERVRELVIRARSVMDRGTWLPTAQLMCKSQQATTVLPAWVTEEGGDAAQTALPAPGIAVPVPQPQEETETVELGEKDTVGVQQASHPPEPGNDAQTPFRWDAGRLERLTAAFEKMYAGNLCEAARLIAQQHGWPVGSVDSKLRALRLHKKQRAAGEEVQENEQPAEFLTPTGIATHEETHGPQVPAASTVEFTQAAVLLAEQHQVPALVPGPFQWDVKVDGTLQRWGLDYAYGKFPFTGGLCSHRGDHYQIEKVNSSQLVVSRATLSPGQVTELHPVPASA